MTEPPRDEFLPTPWRLRAHRRSRAIAIAATFTFVLAFGVAAFWLLSAVLRKLDAPGSVQFIAWLLPTVATTAWAVRSNTPATVSDVEAQGWTEYVMRFVMVGNETTRPAQSRVITGIVFGVPVACYLAVVTVLALAGIA